MKFNEPGKSLIKGKNEVSLLLVRPPSYLWPILNQSDNFLLPLGFPCLAAYLMEKIEGLRVEILDCPVEKVGWKKLQKIIAAKNPDILGVGDMICYMHEGMRLVRMAKEINPEVVTIAGGHFHSALPDYSLTNYPELDYVVRWEGEEAFRQLIVALINGQDVSRCGNLAFRDGDQIIKTEALPLIDPLDSLPIPAYDLCSIDKYAPFGILWPKAITIQGQRGCPYKCNFCSWAYLEGGHEVRNGQETLIPKIRQKSVARILEEIDLLYNKYKIRYLFWVDATWNFDHGVMEELADGIIARNYKLGWWAFSRPDKLLEQEQRGILEKMVKAGLSHVLMGAERETLQDLVSIGKNDIRKDATLEACHLLERKYPSVFRQATWVTGIPEETPDSLDSLGKYVRKTHLDFAAFHPLMPFPGTELWHQYKDSPLLEEKDFSKYDMFYPVLRSHNMTREEIAYGTEKSTLDFVSKQPLRYLKGMFSPVKIRRRLHWWFAFSIGRVIMLDMWHSLLRKKAFAGFAAVSKLWKPSWYDC